ncbi:TlpA disulfide reductase family protein [Mucilaginibacter arboris]|uniref:Redoxin domain-containing protein n=1 Tax=Mucilaginibacter arboris TaxID=2682090 RepID=A0A7K1STX8_9SPHI|nr:TlpA disulfide reductase family protein [Mucilaginibacter arboris]MVN20776.1 redoxin domain-containing protein [Mucilaginibacter arboris]
MKTPLVLIILSLILSLLSCKKSATVTIVGVVDSANGTLVRVINNNFTVVYDSTIIKDNKFTLHSTVPENGFYTLDFKCTYPVAINHLTGWMSFIALYIENNARYKLIANGPSSIFYERYNLHTTSFNQKKLNEFNILNNHIRDSLIYKKKLYLTLADKALTSNQSQLYNAYNDTIIMMDDKLSLSYRASIQQFIKNNPKTLVTPYLMSKLSDLFENHSLYQSILDKLSPEVKKSKYYDEAAELLGSVKKIYVGAKAPDIYGKDVKGNPLNIDYKKNKITLIDFWASYCGPCREQVPELKQLYKKYKAEGLEIISVSIDEDVKKWKHASSIDQLPWYNISELKEQEDSKNIRNFVIKSIPSNYLIDSDGKFIGRDVSLDSIKRIMESNKIKLKNHKPV